MQISNYYQPNLLKGNHYRIALCDIFFKNNANDDFIIKGTSLFTIESKYFQFTDDYEITVKFYKFARNVHVRNSKKSNNSPFEIQSMITEIISSDSYNNIYSDIDRYSCPFNKERFEEETLKRNDVNKIITNLQVLKNDQQNLFMRSAELNNEITKGHRSAIEKTIDKIFEKIKIIAEKIENNNVFEAPFLGMNILFFSIISLLNIFIINKSISTDLITVIVINLLGSINFMNIFFKSVKTTEILNNVLSSPFRFISKYTGLNKDEQSIKTNLISEYNQKMIDMKNNQEQQIQLQKSLDFVFDDVLEDAVISVQSLFTDARQNHLHIQNNINDFTETETRTPEEITGGFENIMYPVYDSEQSAKNNRKVINLSKNNQ